VQTQRDELVGHLIALLFVADGPVSVDTAAHVLDVQRVVLEELISTVQLAPPPGLLLQRVDGHIALSTAPASSRYVERLLGSPEIARLSRAALEVLALVAYRQPITRTEIDAIRGVSSDSAVATLVARGLIEEVGRRDTVGHPVLFGTSMEFLRYVGIASLAELPQIGALKQLADETGPMQAETFELSR
jgi:segregation and condensation protein B